MLKPGFKSVYALCFPALMNLPGWVKICERTEIHKPPLGWNTTIIQFI